MQQSMLALLAAGAIVISAGPAQADSRDDWRDQYRGYPHDSRYDNRRGYDDRRGYDNRRGYDDRRAHDNRKKKATVRFPIINRGHTHSVAPYRIRRHRDVVIVRPYGPLYRGYGHFYHDDDAYKWLAFTAIAVKLLDNLNEQQERQHEAAQVRATMAPIGETIAWREGNASGHVTATREGTSSAGRYCREFQHEVTIGGKRERSYGTACRQPDGSWEVISTGQ